MRSPIWVLALLPLLGGCLTSSEKPAQTALEPALIKAQTPNQTTELSKPTRSFSKPKVMEPIYPDVYTLKGEASDQVTNLLGVPDFRRLDKPAELWQYRHDKCSVDLFLYPHSGGNLSVTFLEVRTYGHRDISLQACFVAILKAKAEAGEHS